MNISDMDKGFKEAFRAVHEGEVILIPYGFDVGEDIILRRYLRRGLAMGVLNKCLYGSVVGTNKRWSNRER